MVKVRQNLISSSLYSWKSPYSMTPTRIVVHNTANDASADAEIKYMNKSQAQGGKQVSYHYAVDDIEAVQGLPENRNGWHAGDGNGKGNREGIAIEICYSKSGGDRFTKAEDNAVELIVDILKRYGWGIDKVTKHQDYSGKYCPHRTLDMGWNRFIKMIEKKLNEGKVEVKPTSAPAQSGSGYLYANYKGSSIVDALKSIGYDSSYNSRKKLAALNGINGYTGTPNQNSTMLNLLKQGKLKSSSNGNINSSPASNSSNKKYLKANYNGSSLVDGLKSIGVNSSFAYRKKIAEANGIKGYTGTPAQNTRMLNLLKSGKLIQP